MPLPLRKIFQKHNAHFNPKICSTFLDPSNKVLEKYCETEFITSTSEALTSEDESSI